MNQLRFATQLLAAFFAASLSFGNEASGEEKPPSLVGKWVSEYDDREANTKSHFLVVRTKQGRLLIKTLNINHQAKKYAYDTELGKWSLQGKRYTEVIDGERGEEQDEYDLEGEVLELTEKVFRYRMTWEGEDGEEVEDLVVEKRVDGPEYPLPIPPKGYEKVSIDDFYSF